MRFLPLLIAATLALPAAAQTQEQSGIQVIKAWSRAMPSLASSAVVYLDVTDGGASDTLVGASTPVAAKAQLHDSKMENGVMKMTPVAELGLSKTAPITLAPGGYHLMLTGMKRQLKAGDSFPLTLSFKGAGAYTTTVKVGKAGAAAMDEMGGMDMK